MTKILSWDVGIKNLAYCMLEKCDNNEFKILKWGVVNLVEDRQKCEYELRGGATCSEVAKFTYYQTDKQPLFNDELNKFCCAKHKEKMMPVVVEVDKTKKQMPKKCYNCDQEASHIFEGTDYAWCQGHYDKRGKAFAKKVRSKKVTVVSCNRQPIQELAEKMYKKFDTEFPDFMEVDEILIENQPSLRNPTMKTLATLLYSYFVIRGITDTKRTKSNIKEVRFVSPSNKLKVDKTTTMKTLKKEDDSSKIYKMTKKLGEKYCKALISKNDLSILEKHKKKDDMCDAFLQGFQYLFSPVPKEHFDKLAQIGFDDTKKVVKVKKISKKDK